MYNFLHKFVIWRKEWKSFCTCIWHFSFSLCQECPVKAIHYSTLHNYLVWCQVCKSQPTTNNVVQLHTSTKADTHTLHRRSHLHIGLKFSHRDRVEKYFPNQGQKKFHHWYGKLSINEKCCPITHINKSRHAEKSFTHQTKKSIFKPLEKNENTPS